MTEQLSLQMRASGLVVALLGIGGLWMAMVFGSEFMDLQDLTPADPLRVNDWRGWFAIFVGLLAAPFMLYAGGKLMFSRGMPEPNLSSKVVKQRGIFVVSLIVIAVGLGLLIQKVSMLNIERLGWEQCYVKQTSWRFGKEIYSQNCEAHGLMKLDHALDKLSLKALKEKLNKEMFEQK
ncbi:hypothetical protein [Aeromonas dhakensis]|uniref:hypothetical protein n=1 Tax=Aeromonas dhakensis TaxID=196024 RepID=UPI000F536379|nr:hypothetical protein [Aeromonas dhakensis]MBL0621031.1 hypothetical protein [Aeromonas dhakensis]MCR6737914.1 hypothetical protein [Aeromonas dhakensis]MDX7697151.1 hypothetical protein [Aeromonas dhakensis]RQM79299.1 hypothetical protein EHZ77_20895 [Aeromonas dhakensis]